MIATSIVTGCGGGGGDGGTPPPPAITAVSVSPGSVALQGVGATGAVSASIAPTGASGTISWRSDNASIATVSGSGANATITAVAGGTTTVTATAGGISGATAVTVTPIVRSISVGNPTAAVMVGGTTTLTATLVSDPGAPTALTWSSSAELIATVSSSGVVSGVAPGSATITVASTAFPAITTTIAVTVSYPVVRSVTVTPANPTVLQGATRQMSAAVDADGGTPTTVTWESLATSIALVNASGLVTAVAPGTATIRATSAANPGVHGTTVVTVTAPTVRAIVMSPATASVQTGATQQYTLSVDADAGANTAVTWSSSNTTVATVNASGLVTSLAPGATTIRATSVLVPAVGGQAALTVTAPPPLNAWAPQTLSPFPPDSRVNDVNQLWSVNSTLAFAVSAELEGDQRVMQWDGTIWTFPNSAPFDKLTAVGGFGNDVYIGNANGRIAKYEVFTMAASGFTEMTVPVVGRIFKITGTGNGTAVALAGTTSSSFTGRPVLVYTSGTWTRLPDPTGITGAYDMAALSPNNIVVVGFGGGRIQRFDGTTWTTMSDPGITGTLTTVAFSGTDIVVLNAAYEGARWNGTSWSSITAPTPRPNAGGEIPTNMVSCNGELYAGSTFGGRVLRLTGTTWAVQATYGVATPGTYFTKLGCGADGVLRAGGASSSIGRMTGSNWTWEAYAPWLFAATIVRPDLAYIAGGNGVVEKWDGTRWQVDLSISSNGVLWALAASNDGLVLASGAGGPTGLWRKSNNAWTFDAMTVAPTALWAASSSFALSMGTNAAMRFNGTTWTSVGAPSNFAPTDMDGSSADFAIAVGNSSNTGKAYQWNGATWSAMTMPGGLGILNSVDVVSPTLAFAVSSNTIVKWNGTQWATIAGPATTASDLPFRTIAANSENDVYLLSATGSLFRYDGTSWTRNATFQSTPGTSPYYTRLAISPTFGLVVGYGGMVYRGFNGANIRGVRH